MDNIPYKVIQTKKGFRLVSHKYKGSGIPPAVEPELHHFSIKDQNKLKTYVRHHMPCVSIVGGELSHAALQEFLKKSYDKQRSDYGDYKVDHGISSDKVQVYHNPNTKHTIVAHRGTADIHDWITDARYALGNTSDKRFQHSKEIQDKAYNKYGKDNLTTIGHSLGSTLAEKVGGDSKEVITLNKPVNPYDALFHKVKSNQTDIKTQYDPVSFLRGFQKGKKATVIKSKTFNPFTEHSTNVLSRLRGSGEISSQHRNIDMNEVHHYHHHIHHASGEGIPSWLNPKKNGAAKFFTHTLPSNLIHKGIPAVSSVVGELATEGNPLGAMAGKFAGDQIANAVGKVAGMGARPRRFVKGSKEAKEFMASLRAKRGLKGRGLVRDAIDDIEELGTVIKKNARKHRGRGIPAPPSRSPITDPSLLG